MTEVSDNLLPASADPLASESEVDDVPAIFVERFVPLFRLKIRHSRR